jgi:prephenate dehydrogenase
MTSSLQLSTAVGAIASSSFASTPTAVRLEGGNFNLWKDILLPNLASGLHRHLDAAITAPEKTITTREGDKSMTTANPEYER